MTVVLGFRVDSPPPAFLPPPYLFPAYHLQPEFFQSSVRLTLAPHNLPFKDIIIGKPKKVGSLGSR